MTGAAAIDLRYGTVTPCYSVSFVRQSKHPAAKLWKTITDPDLVGRWMDGSPASVDLRVGGHYHVLRDGAPWQGGLIIEVEPERALAYMWGLTVVRWSIEPRDEGCWFTFVHWGCADRGADEEGLPAGWHSFLDQLDVVLDGKTPNPNERDREWKANKPKYRAKLDAALVRRGV